MATSSALAICGVGHWLRLEAKECIATPPIHRTAVSRTLESLQSIGGHFVNQELAETLYGRKTLVVVSWPARWDIVGGNKAGASAILLLLALDVLVVFAGEWADPAVHNKANAA